MYTQCIATRTNVRAGNNWYDVCAERAALLHAPLIYKQAIVAVQRANGNATERAPHVLCSSVVPRCNGLRGQRIVIHCRRAWPQLIHNVRTHAIEVICCKQRRGLVVLCSSDVVALQAGTMHVQRIAIETPPLSVDIVACPSSVRCNLLPQYQGIVPMSQQWRVSVAGPPVDRMGQRRDHRKAIVRWPFARPCSANGFQLLDGAT